MMGEPFQFEADIEVSPEWSHIGNDEYQRLELFLKRYANRAHPSTRVVLAKKPAGARVGFYPKTVVTGVSALVLGELRDKYREAVVWSLKRAINNCRFPEDLEMLLKPDKDPDKK